MLKHIKFIDNHGSFCVNRPENTSYLYFPLASEAGLKSSVTPVLGGDSKIDQDTFLLEPVSSENLHNNRSSRNFWIVKEGHIPYSVTGSSAQQEANRFTDRQEDSELTAGFMWQTLKRTSRELGLISTVLSPKVIFMSPKTDNVEIMYVTVLYRNLLHMVQFLFTEEVRITFVIIEMSLPCSIVSRQQNMESTSAPPCHLTSGDISQIIKSIM